MWNNFFIESFGSDHVAVGRWLCSVRSISFKSFHRYCGSAVVELVAHSLCLNCVKQFMLCQKCRLLVKVG